jgi:hypothetical protein
MEAKDRKGFLNIDFFADLTGDIPVEPKKGSEGIGERIRKLREEKGLSLEELSSLTADARGFILFLQDSEIITARQRELIVERILAIAEPGVDLEKIKLIVLMVLWNQQQPVEGLVLELLASHDYSSSPQ